MTQAVFLPATPITPFGVLTAGSSPDCLGIAYAPLMNRAGVDMPIFIDSFRLKNGAPGRGRTDTSLRIQDFESALVKTSP